MGTENVKVWLQHLALGLYPGIYVVYAQSTDVTAGTYTSMFVSIYMYLSAYEWELADMWFLGSARLLLS